MGSINQPEITLSGESHLSATLQLVNPSLSCLLTGSNRSLSVILERGAPVAEYYEGDYSIRPTVEEQFLPTKDKLMSQDVNIEGIPYFETTNESGGYTVIIA